jgi:IclR family acetate operon transcriptional repressor
MRKSHSDNESQSVGTLARGLDILALFGKVAPELTQGEISEQLGIPLPTVHRLTRVLVEHGFLIRDERTRQFRLGLELTRLLPAMLSGMRLPDLARGHLRGLADRTGETVNLALLDGSDVVYLVSEAGSKLLTLQAPVGLRLPCHCTALGKCLLAQLDDDEARRAAGPEPYRALTPRTLTTWKALHDSLEEVRRTGVSVSGEEYEIGLDSIAVPMDWVDGPFAINVSLPSVRDTPEVQRELTEGLRATADAIAVAGGRTGRVGLSLR